MMLGRKKTWGSALAVVLASALAREAAAETICATSRKTTWNVPNGGMVVTRSSGIIATILDAVNEWGTHTVISHGTDSYITHATGKRPTVQDACSIPLKRSDFLNAGPGASQVSLPAAYVFYFGEQTWTSALATRATAATPPLNGLLGMEWYSGNNPADDWGYYQDLPDPWKFFPGNSNRGAMTANFLWGLPLAFFNTYVPTNSAPIYRLKSDDGVEMRYGFNQYMNVKSVHRGNADGNPGVVCSTLPAWATWRAGQGGVSPRDAYTQDEKVRSINALWTKVKNDCSNRSGALGVNWEKLACTFSGFDVCGRAADQVTNAFAVDTADVGGAWKSVRDNAAILPYTISPDCLVGRNGKCYPTGGGSSPWAWDVPKTVQWSGSTAYSCWSN